MDVRLLQTFSTLADTLSFSRTAELLYLSHSTVSKHIAALENELGVPLLKRNTRSVELTRAGASCVREIRYALDHIDEAKHTARVISAEGEKPIFTAGYDEVADGMTPVFSVMANGLIRFQREHENVIVRPIKMSRANLYSALMEGLIDVSFTVEEASSGLFDELEYFEIFHDIQVLVMPKEDGVEYAVKNLDALAKRYPVAFVSSHNQVYPNVVILFSLLGIQPDIQLCDSLLSILYKVIFNKGMTVLPKRVYESLHIPDITAVDMPVRMGLTAARKKGNTSPLFDDLLASFSAPE